MAEAEHLIMAYRILVIDDKPDIAIALRMLLERAGHEVLTAENGRHGLRTFYETRPDLVVLDVRMPDLDGWQTLERLRDLSDVPVRRYGAPEPNEDELERLRPGRDAFRPKPFFGSELAQTVGELLAA